MPVHGRDCFGYNVPMIPKNLQVDHTFRKGLQFRAVSVPMGNVEV